jgi:hypothetical protein
MMPIREFQSPSKDEAMPDVQRPGVLALVALLMAWCAAPVLAGPVTPTTQVTPIDQIEFQQKNIQAQLKELEDRMFHLSQLIREMEPDDSAKLIMAVRRAREELIVEQMKDVMDLIDTKDLGKASTEQQEVLKKLDELKKLLLATDLDLQMQIEQLRKLNAAIEKLDAAIKEQKREQANTNQLATAQNQHKPVDPQKFQSGRTDQTQNKKNTDTVNAAVQSLGQIGQKASASLGKASNTMSKAAGSLGNGKGGDALAEQTDAVAQLEEARNELQQQRQQLLQEIERLVRKQVIANLTDMLERQTAVRQATAALYPRAQTGERESLLRVKQLAIPEGRIVTVCDQTMELIEQTQFSLALPPALKSISRRCTIIQNDLSQSRDNQDVIAAQMQVERDLKDLIETFKELARSIGPPSNSNGVGRDKNKLLSELKVLRMLEIRVHDETRDADGRRAEAMRELPPDLKKKIGTVRDMQAQVRDVADAIHPRLVEDDSEE